MTKVRNLGNIEEKAMGDKGKKDKDKREAQKPKKDKQKVTQKDKPSNK